MRQLRDRPRQRAGIAGRRATFALFATDVHLHAYVQRRKMRIARGGKPLGNLQPIHALHPGEAFGRDSRLIGLERADHMPLDVLQVGELSGLRHRLLHIVLAERPLAQRVCGADCRRGLPFADRKKADGGRIAAHTPGSVGNPPPYGLPRLLVWAHNLMTPA